MNKDKENYTFYDEKEQSKSNKYDNGKNDIFNQKEENYTLEEEKKLAFTININNALFFQNKYDGKENKPENFIVQNMMCKLTNNKYVIYKNKIELLKNNVNYYNIPRFLIFEKYINFAQEIIEKLRELKLKFLYEIVEDDETGLKAFKKLNKRGYIFDFIFIDMYLINKIGIDVLKKIREISSKFNIKINIICLKNEDEKCKIDENLIDDYIDKSIKDTQRLKELILKHMKEVRKEKI
jgi:CheY-like chemotaxis protein